MKYKVGDKVKIIKRLHGHNFLIGEIVTIDAVGRKDYVACRGKVGYWITDSEVAPFTFKKLKIL
jgi:hypothetical protein